MPNFCAISGTAVTEGFLVSLQTARINDADDGYDYSYVQSVVPKRKLKYVFIQNNEDEDIKQIKVIKKVTNQTLMDWSTNSAGVNVGWETFTRPDPNADGDGGNKISSDGTAYYDIDDALNLLASLLAITGLD
jgi:hypothetical protein